jgi:hypothetical protein
MKRVNLAKYGFVRWIEEDFSDDGNRFQCYRVGNNVRVSKLVADGQVYLSVNSNCGRGTLPYDVYARLPHFHEANWDYNGVSLETLTDEDIQKFYEACVSYEKEYEAAEANIVYPSMEDLEDKAIELYAATNENLKVIRALFMRYSIDAALKFSPYEWKLCQEYLNNLVKELDHNDPAIIPSKIHNTSYSFNYMKQQPKDSYWYECIKNIFNKHGMTLLK